MKNKMFITFMKYWDNFFAKHPCYEAFLLSIVFHIIALNFFGLCSFIHTSAFPAKTHEKIIEIEFIGVR